MPIELAARKAAVLGSSESMLTAGDADTTGEVDIRREVFMGIDLSPLGAHSMRVPGEYGVEELAGHLNLPRLAGAINAAQQGGLDFVALKQDFHIQAVAEQATRGDDSSLDKQLAVGAQRPASGNFATGRQPIASKQSANFLDGLKAAAKLQDLIPPATLAVEIPLAAASEVFSNAALDLKSCREILLPLSGADFPSAEQLAGFARGAVARKVQLSAVITEAELLQNKSALLSKYFQAVWCRSADIEGIRRGRISLQQERAKNSAPLPIILELGVAISATLRAAEERLVLIEQLTQRPAFSDIAAVIGTVYDAAYQIEDYIKRGVADGIVFRPASLPTDLASIMRGVLPLLQERAKGQKDLPLFCS